MYGSLFSMVIMLSPLIYRMLIYIFLLLSIIIISYDLFVTMCLISGRFYPLGLATAPEGFYFPHKTYFVPLPLQGLAYCYLYLDLTSWSLFMLNRQVSGHHLFLCSLLVQAWIYTSIFPSLDLCLSQILYCFLGLFWDTGCMSVSLPPDKLADIQQLALSLLVYPTCYSL